MQIENGKLRTCPGCTCSLAPFNGMRMEDIPRRSVQAATGITVMSFDPGGMGTNVIGGGFIIDSDSDFLEGHMMRAFAAVGLLQPPPWRERVGAQLSALWQRTAKRFARIRLHRRSPRGKFASA